MSPSSPEFARRHALEGVDNFRDFGGYVTACGRGLKAGRLFRSAQHAEASDADLAAIRAMNLSAVVDLRRPSERTRQPSRRWEGFAAEVIANDHEEGEDQWLVALREAEGAEHFRDYVRGAYRQIPVEPQHVDLFTRYFAILARADGAVLIHCTAGKDRTGILAALTHHLLGVHGDDMVADYLMTNDAVPYELRGEQVGKMLSEACGRALSEPVVRTVISVDPSYLDNAFAGIVEAYGSIDAYLEQALGVDAKTRAAIEARLLG